jgi:uncharacterized Zn finger protein (UPF0148 family)
MKEAYDYMNTLLDNGAATGFRRVEENGSSWYEIAGDSRHESFAKCPRCGEMVDEDFYVENGMCEGCCVLSHTCCYCGEESDREFKSIDGEFFCPECAVERLELTISIMVNDMRQVAKELQETPREAKDFAIREGYSEFAFGALSSKNKIAADKLNGKAEYYKRVLREARVDA